MENEDVGDYHVQDASKYSPVPSHKVEARVQDDGEPGYGTDPSEHGEDQRKDLIATRHEVDADAPNLADGDAQGADEQRPEVEATVILESGVNLESELYGHPHGHRAERGD